LKRRQQVLKPRVSPDITIPFGWGSSLWRPAGEPREHTGLEIVRWREIPAGDRPGQASRRGAGAACPHLAQAVFGVTLGIGPPWPLSAKAAASADMVWRL
jgi:hypothetical protein